ncbi:hypothetical protein Pelo_15581 [Pelomyxa schiedti]|nr:hypothetical protein Pelo_15581 [Pelomyxa schiedti]
MQSPVEQVLHWESGVTVIADYRNLNPERARGPIHVTVPRSDLMGDDGESSEGVGSKRKRLRGDSTQGDASHNLQAPPTDELNFADQLTSENCLDGTGFDGDENNDCDEQEPVVHHGRFSIFPYWADSPSEQLRKPILGVEQATDIPSCDLASALSGEEPPEAPPPECTVAEPQVIPRNSPPQIPQQKPPTREKSPNPITMEPRQQSQLTQQSTITQLPPPKKLQPPSMMPKPNNNSLNQSGPAAPTAPVSTISGIPRPGSAHRCNCEDTVKMLQLEVAQLKQDMAKQQKLISELQTKHDAAIARLTAEVQKLSPQPTTSSRPATSTTTAAKRTTAHPPVASRSHH